MMKYQNYKLWLTVELDSVDYQRISAFIQTKLLEQYKAKAKVGISGHLIADKIEQILKDDSKLSMKLLGTYFIFPEYKDVYFKDSHKMTTTSYKGEEIKISKLDKINSGSLMNLYVIKDTKVLSIVSKEVKIIDTHKFTSKIDNSLKILGIGDDTINCENYFLPNYGNSLKIKIKKSDSIKSKSLLKFNKLMRKDNTLNDLQNFTLESLKNKNLYYLGYIEQL